MAIFLDVCWRLVLVGLFCAALVLAAYPWLQVDLQARFEPDGRFPDLAPDFRDPILTQTPLQVARGKVEPIEGSSWGIGVYQLLEVEFNDLPWGPPRARLLTLYPLVLLAGLFVAPFLGHSRSRPAILLGLVLFAAALLGLQNLLGYPMIGFVAERNEFLAHNPLSNRAIPTFAEQPQLVVSWRAAPTTTLVVLGIAAVVAGLGFWLPKPDYRTPVPPALETSP